MGYESLLFSLGGLMASKAQDLSIVYRSIDDLIPYVNNSRTHSDEQVTQIAASIKEFNFTNPILIDEQGGIIAGHGRLMAAKKLKIEQVPTITLVGLSDAQRKAYVIADNKLALNADWDFDLLKVEIEKLDELDFNLDILGFTEVELTDVLQLNDAASGSDKEDFNEVDSFELAHKCPKCGYEFDD